MSIPGSDTARGGMGGATRESVTEDPFRVALVEKRSHGSLLGMRGHLWEWRRQHRILMEMRGSPTGKGDPQGRKR